VVEQPDVAFIKLRQHMTQSPSRQLCERETLSALTSSRRRHFPPTPITPPWRWRQQGPPKRWYPTATLHKTPRLEYSPLWKCQMWD